MPFSVSSWSCSEASQSGPAQNGLPCRGTQHRELRGERPVEDATDAVDCAPALSDYVLQGGKEHNTDLVGEPLDRVPEEAGSQETSEDSSPPRVLAAEAAPESTRSVLLGPPPPMPVPGQAEQTEVLSL